MVFVLKRNRRRSGALAVVNKHLSRLITGLSLRVLLITDHNSLTIGSDSPDNLCNTFNVAVIGQVLSVTGSTKAGPE